MTLRDDAETDEQSLKDFCLANGPAYAHPRRIFTIDALPVGGTGKVDRKTAKETIEVLIAGGS